MESQLTEGNPMKWLAFVLLVASCGESFPDWPACPDDVSRRVYLDKDSGAPIWPRTSRRGVQSLVNFDGDGNAHGYLCERCQDADGRNVTEICREKYGIGCVPDPDATCNYWCHIEPPAHGNDPVLVGCTPITDADRATWTTNPI